MAQSVSLQSSSSAARLLFGFIAGFVATLIFHQIGLLLLHFVGMTPNMPYNMNSVPPFGVPQFISLSFWGGVWGIIFVLVEPYLVRSPGGYWLGAINFGAIFPTAVAWFIVRPLKGLPVADVFGCCYPSGQATTIARAWCSSLATYRAKRSNGPWPPARRGRRNARHPSRLPASGRRGEPDAIFSLPLARLPRQPRFLVRPAPS